jgi:hypothetical protein
MLSSQGRYQQIELRHHVPREAKLLEKLGKFNRCLFVRGPKTESSQSELETGQVLPISPGKSDSCSVFTKHRQADAETVARPKRRIYFLFERGLSIQVSRQMVRVKKISVQV